jgi:hypothetical protein
VSRRLRAPCGSAYLAVLLAMIALSAMAFGVALVAGAERRIAASARAVEQLFYAADAGLESATARALAAADYSGRTLRWPVFSGRSDTEGAARSELRSTSTPFYPLLEEPCDLCSVNRSGPYGTGAWRRIVFAVTVEAERVTPGGRRTARKSLSTLIEVLPWRLPADAYRAAEDPEQLARIEL